ncbi:hypothetical protein L7F22_023646 [Adiantum nelumboides]|nr:hypothetical protein [Adiantum nelumboides]
MEMARAMLAHAFLPRSYWADACNTAVYIQNRSSTHALQDMTPFQAYYGRKPTVLRFRVFGCSAFVHIPKEKRQKLDFKSRKLLFLGYSAESDAYRLYDPDTRTTTVSRDVVFDESFITSAEGAAAQPIPILPPPSLPDPPASPVITPSTSHLVPPIQPPDVSPDHALPDSDSDLDVADATPEVDSAPPRREKRIPGWLYSTGIIVQTQELQLWLTNQKMSLKRFPLHRANRHEVGESSRPPQTEDEIFRTQLVTAVAMFTQVMQNPRFMALLQPPPLSQSIGNKKSEPAKAQPQVIHTAESMETPVHLPETMQSPNPVHNAQEQVAETPVLQAVPVQPATFQQPKVGPNGQGSDLQATQQVFPPPSVHPGYFGGGSVFQSMAGHAPGNQFYTPGTVFWGAQMMMPNPMYGGIGLQPGFQSTHGQFGMPQASFGMAGIANQQPYMTSLGQFDSGQGTQINPNSVPMFQSLPYGNLTPLEKPTPYKGGGKGVTFHDLHRV